MRYQNDSTLTQLLGTGLPSGEVQGLLQSVRVAPAIQKQIGGQVSRAVLAQALNLMLFRDLLGRVPTGRTYVSECLAQGRPVVFDHGALRTVALGGMGNLPFGEQSITRVLLPLGYKLNGLYPLARLGMTGRAYTHEQFPEDLPQFFVSELHPERFTPGFKDAVARVTSGSRDPLTDSAEESLEELEVDEGLSLAQAGQLLPVLLSCFQRQHPDPAMADYERLLEESAEMAWIATEGNAFNHATDRVVDLEALVAQQRALGRPLKDAIETSLSGRVRQTAFRADPVQRSFVDVSGQRVNRTVPGSFYEFIQRGSLPEQPGSGKRLDLAFDSANAQGIFRMTAAS